MAFGNVSTAAFTRAEIDNMLKKAMYSEGKVVWTEHINANSSYSVSTTVPDTVDYVIAEGVKIARGGNGRISATASNGSNTGTGHSLVTFDASGKLTVSAHDYSATGGVLYMPLNVTGYHYY